MTPDRNGVPASSGGAVRTAERTGKHPVERTGSARPRQARPKPAGGQGPFDVDDADPRVSSAPGVLDFGALRVPMPPAGQVSVEPSANGRMQAVHVNLPGGRLSVSALAAPKSSKLWPQLAKEIDASLRDGGAKVRSFKGEWGRELHATTGAATSVFVGVDGPRWMIYGVATGPSDETDALDAELRRMLRGTVVVRGKSPYPVRTVLPLTTPEELVDPEEQDASASAPPTVAIARPPAAAPEPARGRAAAEAPSWADPVQRIADAPEADVLPEDEEATSATGLATSSWPVDERTGQPRPPEWTGEQRVPPRRRKAPPVAEVAAAITEPIFIGAVMDDSPAPTRESPVRDRPQRDSSRRAEPTRNPTASDIPDRGRPTGDDQPVTMRLPVVPATPDTAPAAGPDADPQDRAEPGIDAYFGWQRSARPEPAQERPAPERPAPEHSAPEHSAPARSSLDRANPDRANPDRANPDRPALDHPVPERPTLDRPASDRPASQVPVDPLDPSAPVDTRWLDEPGVTTAWDAVAAGLAAEPEHPGSARREPERREPEQPAHQPEPDWAEWARQELDRAVSGRASTAEVEPAPSSFWDRFGLQEPPTGGRAARRHSGPEDGPRAGQHGRRSRDDEIDQLTARRRSREATRGKDPDAPAQRHRSADEADVTELPARTGRVHHLPDADAHGIAEDGPDLSPRSVWADTSTTRPDASYGLAGAEGGDRAGRGLRPGGSDADRIDEAGWSGGPDPSSAGRRTRRSSASDPGGLFGRGDRASGGGPADRSAGSAGRGAVDEPAARSAWADLSRAADAIGRAGRPDRTDPDAGTRDRIDADRSDADWWTRPGSSPGRGDRGARSEGAGAESLFGGARRADSADRPADRASFGTDPSTGRPAEAERHEPADPFRWIDRPAGGDRTASSSPATDRTQEWLDRFAEHTAPSVDRSDGADRPLPRRAAADLPPASPWAPGSWSAAPTGGAGAAGWTTGWPGTGTAGPRPDDQNRRDQVRRDHEEPAREPASGGRRRAEDAGGSTRLSVAELAQRAAREAAAPRRNRHTRPGTDRPE